MKKILITGGNGFIGSNLVKSLKYKNKIYLITRKKNKSNNLNTKKIFYKNYKDLNNKLKSLKIDIIIHNATHYIKNHNFNDLEKISSSNILYGNILLNNLNNMKVKKFINFSTVWQNYQGKVNNAFNLYSASKQAFKNIMNYYEKLNKKTKFYDLYISDTYGENDKRLKLINVIKKKRYNSVIINYDKKSESLFNWYQQLVAESLGKKKKGILPVISKMPRDNHSVMQYYLEGSQKNLFTFFYVHDNKADKIKNQNILSSYNFLKNKKISNIIYAQKKATENVFNLKKIPFRSFEIVRRDEKALGELFCFFILETILLGKILNVNPFDQPAVELIKKETKKILI